MPSKVVVITGASAGVGRAAARAFAGRRSSVGLLARDRVGLKATRREVEAAGARAADVPVEVADATALADAAEKIERSAGPIDVWVNNAMVTVFAPVRENTAQEYRRVNEGTYRASVNG